MKSKKLKTFFLTFSMAFFLAIPLMLNVSAASIIYGADQSGKCGSDVKWSFFESTGNLIINGTGDMDDYVEHAPWSAIRDDITSVEIMSGVTHIGSYAFSSCTDLSKVTIASSVTSIGDYAFSFCSKLRTFSFPSELTSIGTGAFSNCSNITSVRIPDGVSKIPEKAFYKCSGIKNITFSKSLSSIGDSAFLGCAVEKLTLPDGLVSIGKQAFSQCNSFDYLKIPVSLVNIDEKAFSDCFKLTEVNFPNTEISIGKDAFLQKTMAKLTFSGYTGSFAQKYAAEQKVKFKIIYGEIIYKNTDGSVIEDLSPSYYTVGTSLSAKKFPTPQKDGYSFGGWYIDQYLTAIATDISPEMSEPFTIYAKWIPNSYSIAYYDFDGRKLKDLEPTSYKSGDSIPLEQFPLLQDQEHEFVGWYSDADLKIPAEGINSSDFGDKKFYAKWANDESFVINAEQSKGGTISPEGTSTVKNEGSLTYKISANDGYTISAVFVDGVNVGAVNEYTFSQISENHKISVKFASLNNFSRRNEYFVGKFYDIDESEWFGFEKQAVIAKAYELGIMNGYQDGTFYAEGNIRISEAIKMASVVHNIYNGGDGSFSQGEPWYQVYVDYAVSNGIINSDDFDDYTAFATRAEMAYIFAHSICKNDLTEINNISTIPDVASDSKYGNEIYILYNAGVLTGNDDTGTFSPDSNITRAQAAAIISRIVLANERRSLNF